MIILILSLLLIFLTILFLSISAYLVLKFVRFLVGPPKIPPPEKFRIRKAYSAQYGWCDAIVDSENKLVIPRLWNCETAGRRSVIFATEEDF